MAQLSRVSGEAMEARDYNKSSETGILPRWRQQLLKLFDKHLYLLCGGL
jgi:hypothetical protein